MKRKMVKALTILLFLTIQLSCLLVKDIHAAQEKDAQSNCFGKCMSSCEVRPRRICKMGCKVICEKNIHGFISIGNDRFQLSDMDLMGNIDLGTVTEEKSEEDQTIIIETKKTASLPPDFSFVVITSNISKYIEYDTNYDSSIKIFTLDGNLLYEKSFHGLDFPLSSYDDLYSDITVLANGDILLKHSNEEIFVLEIMDSKGTLINSYHPVQFEDNQLFSIISPNREFVVVIENQINNPKQSKILLIDYDGIVNEVFSFDGTSEVMDFSKDGNYFSFYLPSAKTIYSFSFEGLSYSVNVANDYYYSLLSNNGKYLFIQSGKTVGDYVQDFAEEIYDNETGNQIYSGLISDEQLDQIISEDINVEELINEK